MNSFPCILFLQLLHLIWIILSIFHWNSYFFGQEMFCSAVTFKILVLLILCCEWLLNAFAVTGLLFGRISPLQTFSAICIWYKQYRWWHPSISMVSINKSFTIYGYSQACFEDLKHYKATNIDFQTIENLFNKALHCSYNIEITFFSCINICWVPRKLFEHKAPGRFCLFVLRLNVPVNNFSVMSGRSHRFLGN